MNAKKHKMLCLNEEQSTSHCNLIKCQYKHEEMVQCVSTVTPQLRLLVVL